MSALKGGLPQLEFHDQAAFESWLELHAAASTGAWLMFAKKGMGVSTVTKQQAIDSALCHG